MAILNQLENGFYEFKDMLVESDNNPNKPPAKVLQYPDGKYQNSDREKMAIDVLMQIIGRKTFF